MICVASERIRMTEENTLDTLIFVIRYKYYTMYKQSSSVP